MNYHAPIKPMRIASATAWGLLNRRHRSLNKGHGGTSLLSVGVPGVLLHGAGGYTDEIITFGLLVGLVVGLTFLSFRGARNKKNRDRSRSTRPNTVRRKRSSQR
ncbi:MAG TPA: hypothetical protein EYQ82_02065 [Dehalococcoidia bacterium]|nr:hypothetical protein [Dehalococcoidia bacterium]